MLFSALLLTALTGVLVEVQADIQPYEFYTNMDDWPRLCSNGESQSPIDIPTDSSEATELPAGSAVTVQMPEVSRPKVINMGNVLQVRVLRQPIA